ncbi:uncharacterized protein [Nicotiana tomentosiformis]|uniref:uncharacterized protein n=1 Tax=Nicotiana tomentosiformis TaxID=4098 RepID=UPI00051B5753
MNEVNVLCLFNEAQQALNRASILHHESFLRYRVEVNQLEVEVKEEAQKRDMYKLLSEQQEGAIKDLQAELDKAQKEALTLRWEHADLVVKVKDFEVRNEKLVMETNDQTSQIQQKIDLITQLRVEMNEVHAMADERKSKMDWLASEKETAQAKLASVEIQLRVVKEKADKRSQLINELRAQLSSALIERDALGKEYEAMKSKLDMTSDDAERMVA